MKTAYQDEDYKGHQTRRSSVPKLGKEPLSSEVQEFEKVIQRNEDIVKIENEEVSIDGGLFGIATQFKKNQISLDEKYGGDAPYTILTDNMAPLLPPNTDVVLKFCLKHASGEICLYRYRGEDFINQIFIENGKVIAKSINPKYKPVELDPDEYKFIAVVFSAHFFLRGR